MSRRFAILLAVVAVIVFGVVYFWPERVQADPRVSLGVGVAGRLHLGDGGVRFRAGTGIDDRRHSRHDRRRDRHHRWDRGPRAVIVLGAPTRRVERIIERETVIVTAPPAPAVPAAPGVATLAPPAPLDPRGAARTLPADGAGPREWVLGEVVPASLPLVVLDPVAFGLPRPPDGQLYARVGGDVLRLESGSRRILGVLAR